LLEQASMVAVSYLVVDFSNGREIYETIKRQVAMLDVGILVNNVGMLHECPCKLHKISEDLVWNMVNVNVGAVTMMSRLIIPQMMANKRGLIVNVSSATECLPIPLFAIYAATKSFNRSFTLGNYEN
jgi:17beta-estradiol 17-dehydrogenase / very-long-chain 3-oxoacyl-CoA reductase